MWNKKLYKNIKNKCENNIFLNKMIRVKKQSFPYVTVDSKWPINIPYGLEFDLVGTMNQRKTKSKAKI